MDLLPAATATRISSTPADSVGGATGLESFAMSDVARPKAQLHHTASMLRGSVAAGHGRRDADHAKPQGRRAVFCDAEHQKDKVRAQIITPEYSVHDFYKSRGLSQRIARSRHFENISLAAVALNFIWVGYEADQNSTLLLSDAAWHVQAMEHLFCAFFLVELVIRFMAFEFKSNCIKDSWFLADMVFVSVGVFDLWVTSTIVELSRGDSDLFLTSHADVFRLLRMMRFVRVARMVRLLRVIPELMILIKGMAMAMQTVALLLCVLFVIIYVFAIAFTQLTWDTPLKEQYFRSLGASITLLLLEVVLPDHAVIVRRCASESLAYALLMLMFVLLGSLIVMNMLVGILVEVVKTVSDVEREQMQVSFLTHELKRLQGLDEDGNNMISRSEFEDLLNKPEALKALVNIGVDVVALLDIANEMFSREGLHDEEIPFPEFMELILQLRGTNIATLKDIIDLKKWLSSEVKVLRDGILKTGQSSIGSCSFPD